VTNRLNVLVEMFIFWADTPIRAARDIFQTIYFSCVQLCFKNVDFNFKSEFYKNSFGVDSRDHRDGPLSRPFFCRNVTLSVEGDWVIKALNIPFPEPAVLSNFKRACSEK
jgi:hypothetical protein